MTITGFLLARIAEDEAAVKGNRSAHTQLCGYDQGELGSPCECDWPARTLATCAAIRRIVELHPIDSSLRGPVTDNKFYTCACGPDSWPWDPETRNDVPEPVGDFWPCQTLRALAAIYADHPDYRTEWRGE